VIWAWLLRAAGILAGSGAAFVVSEADRLGLGQALAVPVFGACLIGGVFLGELTLPRPPTTGVRTARLTPRQVRDFLPRVPTTVLVVLGAALLGLLSVTTVTGSADDQGRAGRIIRFDCPPVAGGTVTSGRGPWPGSYYSVPILLTVLATVVLAAVVLRAIVRRPHADVDDASADDYRRRSASTVVATLGLVVAVPLAGSALITAGALRGETCAPGIARAMSTPLAALALVAVLAIGYYAARLLLPPSRRRVTVGRP
jgi:hypothetical protein